MSQPLFSCENPMTSPLNQSFENRRKSYDPLDSYSPKNASSLNAKNILLMPKNVLFRVTPEFFFAILAPRIFFHFWEKSTRYMMMIGRLRVVLILLHLVHRSL